MGRTRTSRRSAGGSERCARVALLVVAARVCDTAVHQCVQCLRNEHCPASPLCAGERCVPACSPTQACPRGVACCESACVDRETDPSNCGACDAVCALPNVADHGCAAGACAVGEAWLKVAAGLLDHCVVVAAEAPLHPALLAQFGAARLLAGGGPEACRPFDRARHGTQLGEAAVALVLEAEEIAMARGRLDTRAETGTSAGRATPCASSRAPRPPRALPPHHQPNPDHQVTP